MLLEPISNNTYWLLESRPLVLFLSEPRNWEELDAWAAQPEHMGFSQLRQCLAWLEANCKAKAFTRKIDTGKKKPKTQVFWVESTWTYTPDFGEAELEEDLVSLEEVETQSYDPYESD